MVATTAEQWQKKVSASFTPSSYQVDIFEEIVNGRGHTVVEAVAGSGKSTTIMLGARLIVGYGVYIAFSKEVVTEIEPKLVGTNMEPRTIHSIGNGAIWYNNRHLKIQIEDSDKGVYKYKARLKVLEDELNQTGFLLGRHLNEDEIAEMKGISPDDDAKTKKKKRAKLPMGVIIDLFAKARLDLVDFEGPEYPDVLWDLANHHNTTIPPYMEQVILDVIRHLADWGRKNISVIDFTDMVWLPVVNNWRPKQWNWVFVDECQDISPAQLALIKRCVRRGGRTLWVGDRCQPKGTMVSIPENQDVKENYWRPEIKHVPIETLKKGMKVVSCDMGSSSFVQNGKEILGMTERHYEGNLIVVKSEDKISKYTPNHKCIAKFSKLRNKYCVYMMSRYLDGMEIFRIGKCKLDYGTSSGPAARARAEGAEKLWILDIYDSAKEAAIWEQAISGRFGIPQLVFQRNCKAINLDKKELKEAWEFISDIDKTGDAMRCLGYYGRNWLYPLFDFSKQNKQTSLKRPMEVYACNLVDGIEVLHYENKGHYKSNQWKQASVSREWYNGPVYSMDVDKYELYVADGILTHNCQAIFGFAGANAQSFQQIVKDMKAKVLPLSVCYRCPTSGIDIAKKWVPQIEAAPGAVEGTVQNIKYDEMKEMVREGDMILCRRNAPLIDAAFSIIADGLPAVVKGRAIGKGLVKMIEKVAKGTTFEDFGKKLTEWTSNEKNTITQRGGDDSAIQQKCMMIDDSAECIRIVYERSDVKSIRQLIGSINNLFSDDRGSVTLCSIHRAKGLENERIFLLGPTEINFKGQKEWQKEQEANLSYVAHTRHKNDLIYVAEKNKEKGKKK